ncbi:hypothetical protein RGUI_1292 [Rhodovulum sp. P5]|uniref:hypothetical protein n=1 Tax=Rhodovulum sp. P5 TaxID=1564506 RepID=UPI0009C3B26B|nr:hypothetical protein [Rhodovulum sp. P5]ARE39433.1 hypothetical protein RGUI_1292 [Rhodovulum sp. P5]
MSEELAILGVSPLRRVIGLVALAFLAALLFYIALLEPPQAWGWRMFLLVLGAATLALTEAMRRATAKALILRADGLFDSTGRPIAPLDRIAGIERGMFALKPSNGFTIRLTQPLSRGWAPGVWWRLGTWVGVGGVTSASQAKVMADVLAALLAGGSAGCVFPNEERD